MARLNLHVCHQLKNRLLGINSRVETGRGIRTMSGTDTPVLSVGSIDSDSSAQMHRIASRLINPGFPCHTPAQKKKTWRFHVFTRICVYHLLNPSLSCMHSLKHKCALLQATTSATAPSSYPRKPYFVPVTSNQYVACFLNSIPRHSRAFGGSSSPLTYDTARVRSLKRGGTDEGCMLMTRGDWHPASNSPLHFRPARPKSRDSPMSLLWGLSHGWLIISK
jgi:hypothetical protein